MKEDASQTWNISPNQSFSSPKTENEMETGTDRLKTSSNNLQKKPQTMSLLTIKQTASISGLKIFSHLHVLTKENACAHSHTQEV